MGKTVSVGSAFGHPWPNTVLDGPTRSRRSLGNSKLPYLEGPGVL